MSSYAKSFGTESKKVFLRRLLKISKYKINIIYIGMLINNIYSANNTYFNPLKGGGFFNISDSLKYSEGYSIGENTALKQIADSTASFLYVSICKLFLWEVENLDSINGIPLRCAGDDIDSKLMGEIDGRNKTILEYVRKNGIPTWSRHKWIKNFLHLKKYFASISDSNIFPISNIQPFISNDSTYSFSDFNTHNGNRIIITLKNRITGKKFTIDIPRNIEFFFKKWTNKCMLSFFWGPEGSDTAIFKTCERHFIKKKCVYGFLDLRTGEWLRTE